MAMPWLSIVIPTMGRDELRHTLDSINSQIQHSAIQIIVVGDTHGGMTPELARAKAHVYQRGARYLWLEHDGGLHMFGQPQRQYGMEKAAGAWIMFSADDNILTNGAISNIWQSICSVPYAAPMLFQVRTWQAGVVWQRQAIENGNVDADCFVVPNESSKLGRWENAYNGDFYFMHATAQLWEGRVHWRDDLIALARPQSNEHWWTRTSHPDTTQSVSV